MYKKEKASSPVTYWSEVMPDPFNAETVTIYFLIKLPHATWAGHWGNNITTLTKGNQVILEINGIYRS